MADDGVQLRGKKVALPVRARREEDEIIWTATVRLGVWQIACFGPADQQGRIKGFADPWPRVLSSLAHLPPINVARNPSSGLWSTHQHADQPMANPAGIHS